MVEIPGGELSSAAEESNPRQEEFLAHLFEAVDWSPGEFIGFRLAIDHPIWATRTTMAFEFTELEEIPEPAETGGTP